VTLTSCLTFLFSSFLGEHSEVSSDVLPGREVQQAPEVPRDSVQKESGVKVRAGQEKVRQEAAGLRRTVKAHSQEEGRTNKWMQKWT
jgi:hypothetical protein